MALHHDVDVVAKLTAELAEHAEVRPFDVVGLGGVPIERGSHDVRAVLNSATTFLKIGDVSKGDEVRVLLLYLRKKVPGNRPLMGPLAGAVHGHNICTRFDDCVDLVHGGRDEDVRVIMPDLPETNDRQVNSILNSSNLFGHVRSNAHSTGPLGSLGHLYHDVIGVDGIILLNLAGDNEPSLKGVEKGTVLGVRGLHVHSIL